MTDDRYIDLLARVRDLEGRVPGIPLRVPAGGGEGGLAIETSTTFPAIPAAPPIISFILIVYGIILSGFSGGAVAGLGVAFYFMCIGHSERFALLETISGYAWAFWIIAFFIFMILPQYWFVAVMISGGAILLKVTTKMALIGTMRQNYAEEGV